MIVYKITNLDNGKIYVGQTKFTVEKRFKEHAKSESYIGKAIRKYGEEQFDLEVLATCETREEAYELEIAFIKFFDCMAPNGYNLTEGGKVKGCFPLKSKNLGKVWIAVYQDMISNLADEKLSYEEYRVFLKLLGKVDFENYLTISQSEIANELHMRQPHVSRAIKGLCERHVIIEGPRIGLNKTYRFNPYIAHKGSNASKTISDFDEALTLKNLKENDNE